MISDTKNLSWVSIRVFELTLIYPCAWWLEDMDYVGVLCIYVGFWDGIDYIGDNSSVSIFNRAVKLETLIDRAYWIDPSRIS